MIQSYKTVYKGGTAEITEKKSRFIAAVYPADSEADTISWIESIKKKHWDASHNCFVYTIGTNQEIMRYSDDGEPGGTAGKPMLDVLLKEGICNAAVVVTRYFGGTLLGTGGLVRAYTKAVQEGLNCCTIIEKRRGNMLTVFTDYSSVGKILYLFEKRGLHTLHTEYTDTAKLSVLPYPEELEAIKAEIMEMTGGRSQFESGSDVYFAVIKGKPVIFS